MIFRSASMKWANDSAVSSDMAILGSPFASNGDMPLAQAFRKIDLSMRSVSAENDASCATLSYDALQSRREERGSLEGVASVTITTIF